MQQLQYTPKKIPNPQCLYTETIGKAILYRSWQSSFQTNLFSAVKRNVRFLLMLLLLLRHINGCSCCFHHICKAYPTENEKHWIDGKWR